MWMRPVLRLTEPRNRTEPSISVPDSQEPKKNRNSRFRFGSAPVLCFFGSVLGSRFFVPRAIQPMVFDMATRISTPHPFDAEAPPGPERRPLCWFFLNDKISSHWGALALQITVLIMFSCFDFAIHRRIRRFSCNRNRGWAYKWSKIIWLSACLVSMQLQSSIFSW